MPSIAAFEDYEKFKERELIKSGKNPSIGEVRKSRVEVGQAFRLASMIGEVARKPKSKKEVKDV